MIKNIITAKHKKINNSIQSEIIKDGKEIVKDEEVIKRLFISGKNNG